MGNLIPKSRFWEGNRRPITATEDQEQTVTVLERPPLTSAPPVVRPVPIPAEVGPMDQLREYEAVASSISLDVPSIAIEHFKAFLVEKDLPIFNLQEVIAYMDDKSKRESVAKYGWEWRPLRELDHIKDLRLGREAREVYVGNGRDNEKQAASDYYVGPGLKHYSHSGMYFTTSDVGGHPVVYAPAPRAGTPVYSRVVPIHALKKVALIESEFKKTPVKFFVSDYAPAPRIQYPDPFLMAIVPNPRLVEGEGRFILDFWDEPGFGIQQQVK